MCGIVGALWPGGRNARQLKAEINCASNEVRHRGPDDEGVWIDANQGVGLGHRRLSILDLSSAGSQPMVSASGRYVVTFNGEIYNHLELRKRLKAESGASRWRGHSDTETLLAAVETWGLIPALKNVTGMFAFALWDREMQRLWLARDRIGEKPLYYGKVGGSFAFASEVSSLRRLPNFDNSVDPSAVTALLAYLYVPDPYCIYRDIRKLLPGTCLEVRDGVAGEPIAWWSLEEVISKNSQKRASRPKFDPVEKLDGLLRRAIKSQMLSDVPLGSFLSGGIDSSLVTALMQAQSTAKIRTYSIGFEIDQFNEAPHAAAVAKHLGTDHTEYIVTEADALSSVPDIAPNYDEPFADSSQLPSLILSKLAKRDITVALTGDGGDEIFGGYNRYSQSPRAWKTISPLPAFIRHYASGPAFAAAKAANTRSGAIRKLSNKLALPVDKVARVLGLIGNSKSLAGLYAGLVSVNKLPADLVSAELCADIHLPELRGIGRNGPDKLEDSRWMMANDTLAYLPGDILVKVDRATMAASLESRAPFLDHSVIDFAWSLPTSTFLSEGKGKELLSSLLYRYVPQDIVDRPKQGFSVPVDRWLRGELRDWGESLISPSAVNQAGLLNPISVTELWEDHQKGVGDYGHQIWAILMLQAWSQAR